MIQQESHQAGESWRYYRAAFSRRSHHFPSLAILVSLIDRICERGYAERLYAGASLDNLVISLRPQTRDRRQTILVIPQGDAVEFRLYPADGEETVSKVALHEVEATIDRLLSELTASSPPSSGAASREPEA